MQCIPDIYLPGSRDIHLDKYKKDLLNVIESTKLLKEAQAKEDSAEAKATLPTLSVSDLDREIKKIPIEISSVQGVDVITHNLPSSGEQWGGGTLRYFRVVRAAGAEIFLVSDCVRGFSVKSNGVTVPRSNTDRLKPGFLPRPLRGVPFFVLLSPRHCSSPL